MTGPDAEAQVSVRGAGDKGMGAYAAAPIKEGGYVGSYRGTVTTHEETMQRYGEAMQCDYLFNVDREADISIDAQNSTHFSRYFNHAEFGNLFVEIDQAAVCVDFYAARDIDEGEELTL